LDVSSKLLLTHTIFLQAHAVLPAHMKLRVGGGEIQPEIAQQCLINPSFFYGRTQANETRQMFAMRLFTGKNQGVYDDFCAM
jgi:hypothetical protein